MAAWWAPDLVLPIKSLWTLTESTACAVAVTGTSCYPKLMTDVTVSTPKLARCVHYVRIGIHWLFDWNRARAVMDNGWNRTAMDMASAVGHRVRRTSVTAGTSTGDRLQTLQVAASSPSLEDRVAGEAISWSKITRHEEAVVSPNTDPLSIPSAHPPWGIRTADPEWWATVLARGPTLACIHHSVFLLTSILGTLIMTNWIGIIDCSVSFVLRHCHL